MVDIPLEFFSQPSKTMSNFWRLHARAAVLAIAAAAVGVACQVQADVSVSATVEPAATTIGEPVHLSVTINGSQSVAQVPNVPVDGAQTQHIGASTQMRLVNTSLSVSLTHTYLITPTRKGDLTIPAIEVNVGGKIYRTEPVKVQVLETGQTPAGTPAGEPAPPSALAEVELPSRPLYVGEAFAAEARLLVPQGVGWRIERMPDFQTDAFTKTPFQQPQQSQQARNGQAYHFCGFRTVMTAIKSGKVPLGPLTFNILMAAPKKPNNNPSPFNQLFNGFPFDNQATALQERKVILEQQTIEVRELPTEGKPASFRGAIGRFRFSTSTGQNSVKLGEPLNITIQVEGEGNFDRIEAPPMLNTEGWRAYPPEATFAKSEETGLRGVKTFRIAIVPEKAQSKTPVFEFAAFDPESGTYQTVKSASSDLVVEGAKPPEPERAAVRETPTKPETKPDTKPEAGAVQKEPVLQETLTRLAPEASFWKSRTAFWGLQAIVAAGLGGAAAAVALSRARARRGPGLKLLRDAQHLQKKLKSHEDRGEFLRLATRVLQLRSAARSGQPEDAVDAAAAIRALGLQERMAQEVHWLFETDAGARFAGAKSSGALKQEERTRVLHLLEGVA